MFDIQKLKEYMDVQTVIDALGVENKRKSRRIWIHCPFHADKKIGSAYLNEAGYFKCHSCGTEADIFDVVMAINNCSFSDACLFLASLFGGAEDFGISEKEIPDNHKRYSTLRLSIRELEVLEIPSNISFKTLFLYSEEHFKRIVTERAKEYKDKYEKLLTDACRRDGSRAVEVYSLFGNQTSSLLYSNLATEVKQRITVCEELLKRFA